MTLSKIWLVFVCLALCSDVLSARAGRVVFKDGKAFKGDIEEQTQDSGREVVVLAIKSGSMIILKEDLASIIYWDGPQADAKPSKFHAALERTPAKPVKAKPINRKTPYDYLIHQASLKNRLDPNLVKALIRQESNFNHQDVSHKGAVGLMQLMPGTAGKLGVGDSFNPNENIDGGTRYLKMMLEQFDGDLKKALAAYNAGPNAVKKYGHIPPYKETQNYVRKVIQYYNLYRGTKLISFVDKDGSLVITDGSYTPQK